MIGFSDIEDSDVSDDQEFQQIQPIPIIKRETPIQRIENTIVKVQPTELNVPIIQEPQRVILHKRHLEIVPEQGDLQLELDDLDSIHVPEEEYQLIQEDPPELQMQKEQQPQIPKNFLNINHLIDEDYEEPVQNQKIFEKEIEQEQTPNQAITYDKSHQSQFLNTKDFPKNRFYNPKSSAIYKKFISKEYCDFDDIMPNELQDESQQFTEEADPLLEGLENVIQQLMLPPKKIKKFEDRFIKPEVPQRQRQAPQKKESKLQKEKTAQPIPPKLTAEEQKKKQLEERLNRQAQLEEQKKKNRISQEKKVLQILDKKIYEQGLIKYKCVVQEKSKETTQYLRWSELALISDGSNKVMDFELQTREKQLHHLLKDITSCFTSHKIVDGENKGAQNIHVDQEEEIIQPKSNRSRQYNDKERKRRQKSQKDDHLQQSNSNMNQEKNSSIGESSHLDNNKSQQQPEQQQQQQQQNKYLKQQIEQEKSKYKKKKIIDSSDSEDYLEQFNAQIQTQINNSSKQKQKEQEGKQQDEKKDIQTQQSFNENEDNDLFDADAVNIFYLKNQREKRIDKRFNGQISKPTTQITRQQINKSSDKRVVQSNSSQTNEQRKTRERQIEDKRNRKQVSMKQETDEYDSKEEIKTRKVKRAQQKFYNELSDYSSVQNVRNTRKKIRK